MPMIDMPLEELFKYSGITPRPENVDEYWEQGLAEMREVDPQVELVKAEFQTDFAECYDLYFTGVKGARIHAQFLRPKNIKGKVPAMLEFHGYAMDAGNWVNKLHWVAQGFCVAALNCRGQGSGKSEDVGGVKGRTINGDIIRGLGGEPEDLLYRQIFLDTAQLGQIIMNLDYVEETKVCAMGGSQGGGLALACASLEPRISKVCTIFPFLCDYKRVWEMDLAKDAYQEIREYFRYADPCHEREEEIFTRLGYVDVQNLTHRIKGEVLFFTALMDTICPPSTQFAAYNNITSPKQLKVYPDYGHEELPGARDLAFEFFSGYHSLNE